jgi:hypothetical protein
MIETSFENKLLPFFVVVVVVVVSKTKILVPVIKL